MTVTARTVKDLAREVQGLQLSDAQCNEIAVDVERHVAAIAAARSVLELNDEPARFAALLRAAGARRSKR